jgi:hypothetical protein
MPDTPWSVPEKDAQHALRTVHADEHRIDRDVARDYREVCRIGRRVRVCTRTVRTPGKLPNLEAVKIELPDADPKVQAKVRAHLVCVFIGGLLAIICSFIAGGVLLHFAPFIPTIPNIALESLDRVNNR